MADIKQITLPNNITYDIKDATAIQEPVTEGTSGQVLTTDGAGGRTWTTVGAGNETDPIFSASAAAGITSSDISNWNGKMTGPASEGINGQVLATNGSGGRYWMSIGSNNITYGTQDLTPGVSALPAGQVYLFYELTTS